MSDPNWRIQDGGYFNTKDVIVTYLLLLMAINQLKGSRILSDMLRLRFYSYTSNRDENIDIKNLLSNQIGLMTS